MVDLDLLPESAEEDLSQDYFSEKPSPLEALKTIKDIGLSHMTYDCDENMDGEWEYTAYEEDDGDIEFNFPEEIKIIEHALEDYQSLQKDYDKQSEYVDHLLESIEELKQFKQALMIIKEKKVDVNYDIFCSKDYKHYESKAKKGKYAKPLTAEEFDFIVEVLRYV